MPQEFHVLRCYSCGTFQVHQVKKSPKWECKLCGAKQSIKKVYGRGLAADCRKHVQKLNSLRAEEGHYDQKPQDALLEQEKHNGKQWSQEDHDQPTTRDSKWQQFCAVPADPESDDMGPPGWDGTATDAACDTLGFTTSRAEFIQAQKHTRKRRKLESQSHPYRRRQEMQCDEAQVSSHKRSSRAGNRESIDPTIGERDMNWGLNEGQHWARKNRDLTSMDMCNTYDFYTGTFQNPAEIKYPVKNCFRGIKTNGTVNCSPSEVEGKVSPSSRSKLTMPSPCVQNKGGVSKWDRFVTEVTPTDGDQAEADATDIPDRIIVGDSSDIPERITARDSRGLIEQNNVDLITKFKCIDKNITCVQQNDRLKRSFGANSPIKKHVEESHLFAVPDDLDELINDL